MEQNNDNRGSTPDLNKMGEPYRVEEFSVSAIMPRVYWRMIGPTPTGLHSTLTKYSAERHCKILNAAYAAGAASVPTERVREAGHDFRGAVLWIKQGLDGVRHNIKEYEGPRGAACYPEDQAKTLADLREEEEALLAAIAALASLDQKGDEGECSKTSTGLCAGTVGEDTDPPSVAAPIPSAPAHSLKCPVCFATGSNVSPRRTTENNGIYGPGYRSWAVDDYYLCLKCGVRFNLPPLTPIL